MSRIFFLSLFLICQVSFGFSQARQIQAYNNYIKFSNESIHGLVVVHVLLESFNKQINSFVDDDGIVWTNDMSELNVFDNDAFYDYKKEVQTPFDLYELSLEESRYLPVEQRKSLNPILKEMKTIISGFDKIRYEIEDFIQSNDMNVVENTKVVYEKLEICVKMFDDYYSNQRKLLALIDSYFEKNIGLSNFENKDFFIRMKFLHRSCFNTIHEVRMKDSDKVAEIYPSIGRHRNSFINFNTFKGQAEIANTKRFRDHRRIIDEKLSEFSEAVVKFTDDGAVPPRYKPYGKFYYYHNSPLISNFNRYGFGMVHEMNNICALLGMPVLLFSEMPVFFKVIYPEKLIEDDHIESSDDKVEKLPTKIRDRMAVSSTQQILVDTFSLEIKLFDHLLQDGDIVSLNFNGDWILENQSIENKPMKLKLRLNKEGKNFLLLHAVNIGKRPPNTVAISYYYKGEKQEIMLQSDLDESAMIEILYSND